MNALQSMLARLGRRLGLALFRAVLQEVGHAAAELAAQPVNQGQAQAVGHLVAHARQVVLANGHATGELTPLHAFDAQHLIKLPDDHESSAVIYSLSID